METEYEWSNDWNSGAFSGNFSGFGMRIFYEEKYEHESQMDYQIILDRMNEELKKYIPGPRDSTWMALDLKTPMTAAFY